MNTIKSGQLYKHYKGDIYKIITLAKDVENEAWLVVYERQTDIVHTEWKTWVRKLTAFTEEVNTPTYKGPRFTYIEG